MINARYKTRIDRAFSPLARAFLAAGISPNMLTLAAPVLGTLACLWFLRTRAVIPFCLLIAAIGALDALDGLVARLGGKVSQFGAYLDAMCDRYFEAIVVLTVASATGYWVLSMAVLSGSLLVSYAKARAAMEVPVANQEWPDLMERAERSLVFLAGLVLNDILGWRVFGRDLFWWTLAVLAVLVHVTVMQRMWRARTYILARGR